MVFGLDTILPMEFLIPTLRVAKELNWTRHKLSKRLEDLEKLDKTHLAAVHGIYALKRRQKKFHDSHIGTKEFKLGDLVLLFTLKQFVYIETICFKVYKARTRTLCDFGNIIQWCNKIVYIRWRRNGQLDKWLSKQKVQYPTHRFGIGTSP